MEIRGNHSVCQACGGESQYVPVTLNGLHLSYWRWYKGFKRAHKDCERNQQHAQTQQSSGSGLRRTDSGPPPETSGVRTCLRCSDSGSCQCLRLGPNSTLVVHGMDQDTQGNDGDRGEIPGDTAVAIALIERLQGHLRILHGIYRSDWPSNHKTMAVECGCHLGKDFRILEATLVELRAAGGVK